MVVVVVEVVEEVGWEIEGVEVERNTGGVVVGVGEGGGEGGGGV